MKGIFEFEVGEPKVKRGFKFGTYAFKVACDKDGSSLSQLLRKAGITENRDADVNIGTLLNVFYGSAVAYTLHNKQTVDFTDVEVSEWIDELGLDEVNRMLREGFNQYSPKNS